MSPLPARLSSLAVLLALGLTACSPRLTPLYRDFEVTAQETPVETRVTAALQDAGWDVVETETPNLIATEEQTMSNWGLYKVRVGLEVAALGDRHVRVFVHPYRDYITGGRSKIPFLKGHLRDQVLKDLAEALKEHGLQPVGTPFEKDRVAMTQ